MGSDEEAVAGAMWLAEFAWAGSSEVDSQTITEAVRFSFSEVARASVREFFSEIG